MNPTLTLEEFAKLPSVWPENICSGNQAVLIAQISPDCKRKVGDEGVLARALVFIGADNLAEATLARLTIRKSQIKLRSPISDFKGRCAEIQSEIDRDHANLYIDCLEAVLNLPILILE